MMTSLNGNAFRVTGPFWGESNDNRWIPLAKDQWESFEFFFDISRSKVLNEQSKVRWFGTPWRSYDATIMEVYLTTD